MKTSTSSQVNSSIGNGAVVRWCTVYAGATDLLNLVDMFGSGDKDSINTAIEDVKEKMGEICEDITGSKEVADVLGGTISGGIISALTDYNMTNDASIGEALIPFIAPEDIQLLKSLEHRFREELSRGVCKVII